MSFHTKEAQLIKKKAIAKILGRMYENLELKKAGKEISSSHEPKMYLRMARLLAGTDDSVFIDEVENLLAKDADGDKLKNKLRGISERNIPLRRKRVLSDRLHHGIPLELMDSLMKQDPDVMLEFLQAAEADGRYFGDSASNIDNSFQEQSHTGAKDKATSKFRNYPYELGIEGDRQFSAHPYGTAKGSDKSLNRKFNNGTEMYQAFLPAIEEAEFELKLGINSDTSRRVVANNLLVEEGLLLPGEDNWSTSMPEERIKTNREFLAKPEPGMQVAAAQNPYKYQDTADLKRAGINPAQIESWDVENQIKLLKKNGGIRLQRRLARQFADAAGEIPLAGLVAGPVAGMLLGQSPAEALGDAIPINEIESDNTADVSREGNLFVDRKTNMVMPTPETVDQGKQGLAYKDGKPVAVPYGSVAGEATTSDMFGAFVNQTFEVQKRRFGGIGLGRRKLEKEEKLRALPATHPARAGFPLGGGM
jgi:hypothetical protein